MRMIWHDLGQPRDSDYLCGSTCQRNALLVPATPGGPSLETVQMANFPDERCLLGMQLDSFPKNRTLKQALKIQFP